MKNTFPQVFILFFSSLCFVGVIGAWSFFGLEKPAFAENEQVAPPPTPFFTLIINPAGDAKNAGREIDGTYERGITMQCATHLKKALEERISGLRVILTRLPGDTLEPLQNASFANRLRAHLYISLHFFESAEKRHPFYLYYLLYDPAIDLLQTKGEALSFIPYDQAFRLSLKKTRAYGEVLYRQAQQLERLYTIRSYQPRGVPFKPLVGIAVPAIACECGIRRKDDWRALVPLFVDLLENLIVSERT